MRGLIPKNLVDKILLISLFVLTFPVLASFLASGIDYLNPSCSHKFFLSNACKSINAEANAYIRAFNRGQTDYRMENSKFANSFAELQLGIPSETLHYSYLVKITDNSAFVYAIPKSKTGQKIIPNSFVGAVFLDPSNNQDPVATINIVCKGNSRESALVEPYIKDGILVCGQRTQKTTSS